MPEGGLDPQRGERVRENRARRRLLQEVLWRFVKEDDQVMETARKGIAVLRGGQTRTFNPASVSEEFTCAVLVEISSSRQASFVEKVHLKVQFPKISV